MICAYGESPYLEECIRSLRAQRVRTRVLMSTSTPGAYLEGLAEKYGIPLRINTGEKGIAGDWNFALRQAETPLITLAHQDDVYAPEYVEEMLRRMNRARRPILFCSDYMELRGYRRVGKNRLLGIKRVLRVPMRALPGVRGARRLSLAFGNAICCPSVTYRREVMEAHPFPAGLKTNLDWQEWETLSRERGSFVSSPRPLVLHRIHPGSETSRLIGERVRGAEDEEMFRRFWPAPVARGLARLYAGGERSNDLEEPGKR